MKHLCRALASFRDNLYRNRVSVNRVCDFTSGVFMLTSPLAIYMLVNKKVEEKKYVLVGNENVVQNVTDHIGRTIKESALVNFIYKWKSLDIEIIKEESQYEQLKKEKKQIELLFCASTKTDHTQQNYLLPKALPENIKNKKVVMVNPDGEEISMKSLMCLEKNSKVKECFQNSKVQTIPLSNTYMHYGMDESTKASLLYVVATITAIALKIARR